MSYTYECTVVCNDCGNQFISGEPHEAPEDAKYSAIRQAERNNWAFDGYEWVCPICLVRIHPQSEHKQEVENDDKANL